ncbi:terminase small subunit protein [Sphingopyxis lindanitolerans]|uniref:terminase small subunit-like protein n=1 Tax=Sphingopyxis lindanitolerans TaxID=2054227 RepID=UPI0018640B88|nr:terminase small subunit protein [Sphingopyxis lindanitolerans]
MARPKTLNRAKIMGAICERMIEGDSLRAICAAVDMPSVSTVFRWLSEDTVQAAELREQYARAREGQADAIFDEILQIADDGRNDYVERLRSDGEKDTVFDAEHVQRSKLRVDARKWVASKLAPKKYGDDIRLRHADAEGASIRDWDGSSAAARLASIIAGIGKRTGAGSEEEE